MKKTISILKVARETIEVERDTIGLLLEHLDENFEEIIEHIFQSSGRLIVTGIGKSAIIGQKYVSTFNSTGTPAFFMHAADAVHGDVGMVQPNDIIICISKSGETPEVRILLPILKHLGNKIISVVGNRKSYLAKQSDYVIYTPIQREADPNNLAPTASTTAQLVIGDAIATCLLAIKGFNSSDFALLHPGGSLGKQLYLTVGDLVIHHSIPQVSPDHPIPEVIVEISGKRLGATAVLDNEQVVGIITDGDLRRMLNHNSDWKDLKGKDIMNVNPKKIEKSRLAIHALKIMREHSISQLLVEDKGKYIGMVHLHDIIKEGII